MTPKLDQITDSRSFVALIADGNKWIRSGLQTTLQKLHLKRILIASTCPEAEKVLQRQTVSLFLLDPDLPPGHVISLMNIARTRNPTMITVLFISNFRPDYLNLIHTYPIRGILNKNSPEDPRLAIKSVLSGKKHVDSAFQQHISGDLSMPNSSPLHRSRVLSHQEKQLISLVAEGWTNGEIAEKLQLSSNTIRNYLSRIMDKLQMTRRSQVAAFYERTFRL